MKKLFFTGTILSILALAINSCGVDVAVTQQSAEEIVLENIYSRKSVRSYTDAPVEEAKVDKLIRAGMAAPSGMDHRPWELVVVNDRDMLAKMAENLPYAKMLGQAPMAIVVCGDVEKSNYWYIDCSAVTQNILLAAEALGLGAVWTATYPFDERMDPVASMLGLPENIKSLNIIPIGYPAGDEKPKDKYDSNKIHYNKW